MAAMFGSLLIDAVLAFLLGLLGGFGAELIINKGDVEMPHKGKNHFHDIGFISNLIVGGIAALAIFYIVDTISLDPAKFVGISITAGVGGASILTAFSEKIRSTIAQGVADEYKNITHKTASIVDGVSKGIIAAKEDFQTKRAQEKSLLTNAFDKNSFLSKIYGTSKITEDKSEFQTDLTREKDLLVGTLDSAYDSLLIKLDELAKHAEEAANNARVEVDKVSKRLE